jgi:hypothetical protein
MTDRYHYNINLPFTFNPIKFIEQEGPNHVLEQPINLVQLIDENPEMQDWLNSKALLVTDARYFHSLPNQRYYKHIDVNRSSQGNATTMIIPKYVPKIKLNFIFNSTGTIMKWYKLLPGKFGNCYVNEEGESVLAFPDESVTEIYTAEVDKHCLIDAGTIHDLSNSENNNVPRECYSLILDSWWQSPLTWDKAVEIFKPHTY